MDPYPEETEAMMRAFYETLNEKAKRRYAAVEAHKLGRGGIRYMAQLLGCARSTIYTGLRDLAALPHEPELAERIRRPGGGRHRYEQLYPEIDRAFLDVLAAHTAGDPMNEQVRWTNLTRQEIARLLAEQHGIVVSETVVRQLLRKHHYRRRKAQKNKP
jgi:transposase